MSKFKVGDRVKLVGHSFDTDENLEIGYTGTVAEIIEGNTLPLLITWNRYKCVHGWWVEEKTVRHLNLVLENK